MLVYHDKSVDDFIPITFLYLNANIIEERDKSI